MNFKSCILGRQAGKEHGRVYRDNPGRDRDNSTRDRDNSTRDRDNRDNYRRQNRDIQKKREKSETMNKES